jgi:hypothetical protein
MRTTSEQSFFKMLYIAVGCAALLYVIHVGLNYRKIEKKLESDSAVVVHPVMGEHDVAEIGYIYEMRREHLLTEGRLNLVWFVVVPSTNVHYSCSYEEGFADFETGDGVRLIHRGADDDPDGADYGDIVGLHGREQGKTAMVWVIDADRAELELGPDEN